MEVRPRLTRWGRLLRTTGSPCCATGAPLDYCVTRKPMNSATTQRDLPGHERRGKGAAWCTTRHCR
jgi:hypothetical protein